MFVACKLVSFQYRTSACESTLSTASSYLCSLRQKKSRTTSLCEIFNQVGYSEKYLNCEGSGVAPDCGLNQNNCPCLSFLRGTCLLNCIHVNNPFDCFYMFWFTVVALYHDLDSARCAFVYRFDALLCYYVLGLSKYV